MLQSKNIGTVKEFIQLLYPKSEKAHKLINVHEDAHSKPKEQILPKLGPEVIKLFYMLNSTKHEIFPAHKC